MADDEEWLGGRLAREALDAGDPAAWFEPLYAAAEQGETHVPWDRGAPNRWLVAWAEASRPRGAGRRAIVVGAGLGDDAELIAGLGFKTVAFDVSPTAARLARERFPGTQVDYRAADLLELPMAWREAYDLVVEIRTVQSLPSAPRPAAIAAIRGLVAPGGDRAGDRRRAASRRPGRRPAVAAHPGRDRVVRRRRPADGAARRAARRGRLRLVGGGAVTAMAPKRSVRIRAGSWPASTSRFETASTKPVGPQMKTCGCGVGRRAELRQHRGADAAAEVARAGRGRARVGPAHVEVRGGLQRPQLVGVQRQRGLPDRDQHAGVDLARVARAMAQHRHQRHEPRPAAGEQQRAAVGDRPRERAADRPAHLDLVADLHDLGQVGRDLAVLDPVDRDRELGSSGALASEYERCAW